MKIWFGYGSEHSANLVIIGEFSSPEKAAEALNLLNDAAQVATADEADGLLKPGVVQTHFTDRQMALWRRTSLSFSHGDPEQLLYDLRPRREGSRVVITTEENDINALLKILLHHGAKIGVYSAHDHGGPYGRPTHRG